MATAEDVLGRAAPAPGFVPEKGVVARSPWQHAWARLRRDKVGMVCSGFILLLVAFAAAAPLFERLTGHTLNKSNSTGTDDLTLLPVPPLHGCDGLSKIGDQKCFVLGASDALGHDMLVQLAYGARTSLFIGVVATILTMSIALLAGLAAGFFGGVVDGVLSRVMEVTAAFPYLLFAIIASVTFGASMATVIAVITVFSWFYAGRIFRADVLSLREREFVVAARMLGASSARILFRHVLPHLVGPLIVLASLSIAAAISFEAALSFLGFGLPIEVASWGRMINQAVPGGLYRNAPHLMLFPGSLLVLTVLAFNLLGDSLRDALDPRGGGI
ncbi:MAG: peptide/nickel transport system permease protein [Gaiellaceae bacterium]|nr:peptide/nickel transport system permease protein [Gaiellaceae bacterium]